MNGMQINVPYTFAGPLVRPGWRSLRFGVECGVSDPSSPIDMASERLSAGDPSPDVLDLASRRRDEQLSDVVGQLAEAEEPLNEEELQRAWAFVALAWVHENAERFADPLDVAEKIYTELGYPPEVAPLVRYMPVSADAPLNGLTGDARLMAEWERYLVTEREYFTARYNRDLFEE